MNQFSINLTLLVPIPTKRKMKAFIKPFEALQKSVKKKINLIFISIQLSEMHGTLSVKYKDFKFMYHKKH